MSLQQLEEPPPYTNHITAASFPSVPQGLISSSHQSYSSSPASPFNSSPSPKNTSMTAVATLPPSLSSNLRNNTLPPLQGRQIPEHVSLEPIRLPEVPITTPRPYHRASPPRPVEEPPRHQESSLSEEDLLVAGALADLRTLGSPPTVTSSPVSHVRSLSSPTVGSPTAEPEPLLSLLKSSHPWLGTTIDGSLSAYASTISHSPRFVQYGVNLIERNVGTPVASTVGQVGKRTGVEDRLRNYFDSRRPGDVERADPRSFSALSPVTSPAEDAMDVVRDGANRGFLTRSQRSSVESLPAYDESRSPPYEKDSSSDIHRRIRSEDQRAISRSWSTQLMITTSGLGVALSESSLKSLQFCLGILRNANTHVRNLMLALKTLLEEFEQTPLRGRSVDIEAGDLDADSDSRMTDADTRHAPEQPLAARIRTLNDEIWNTLKTVVSAVSRYTGGALPDNASALVRGQLLSVPQRYQRAMDESAPLTGEQAGSDTVSNAHRMLAFAREGLDMIAKVGGVVESTIVSAEGWLDTIGRRKPTDSASSGPGPIHLGSPRALGDVKDSSNHSLI